MSEPQSRAASPQIVLIEDNRGDVGLIREALEQHGVCCDVTVFGNGEIATDFIDEINAGRERCPSLFIVDLNLPKKPGKEVLKYLRASAAGHDAAVVVFTSSNSQKDRDDVAPLAPLHYLRKPSSLDEFMALGALFKQIIADRCSR